MIRRLLAIMTALSLLLCITTLVLWALSYMPGTWRVTGQYRGDGLGNIVRSDWFVLSMRGEMGLGYTRVKGPLGVDGSTTGLEDAAWDDLNPRLEPDRRHRRFALRFGTETKGYLSCSYIWFKATHWLPTGVLLVLPLVWLRRRRREQRDYRRRQLGLCPACGYDVRVTPARCPECGAPVPLRRHT